MRKLRRTRKKVTKSHISSTEIEEMYMTNSKGILYNFLAGSVGGA